MTSAQLKEAYSLIKSGDKAAARRILQPYVKAHPKNPNGWWLLANAVTDTYERVDSLERVVALDPDFTPAQRALRKLEAEDDFLSDIPRTSNTNKKSNKTTTVVGIGLIVVGVSLLVCGGIFFAVAQGTSSLMNEIAQNITIEPGGSFSNTSNSGAFSGHTWDVVQRGSISVGGSQSANVDTFDDDGWTLTGNAGQRVTIEVVATDNVLDPQLYVYSPNGSLLAENDDIDMFTNTNSRVVVTLPESGNYGIVVSAFGSGGGYRVTVR